MLAQSRRSKPRPDAGGGILFDPFRHIHDSLPDVLRFPEINNPSRWKAHCICLDHAQIVACGFWQRVLGRQKEPPRHRPTAEGGEVKPES
jgi:hypothetical protein